MATTAARDDRLTPNAKALLQVIRARCGKGTTTSTCKSTLANIMSRSTRTIRRYLLDLARWGYVELQTRRGRSGLDTGLVIKITAAALPFFAEPMGLARWLAQKTELPAFEPAFPGVTLLTPKNPTRNISSMPRQERALDWKGLFRQPPG
ncbi:helix-turn-helix domain-containing protein [Fulvimarina sp. 2208YS6-2-32]|uniref:Helix-turn-helix domain-containing protein n=1 Tax=Fulvimarina uroteuthidis TaxID=3098149 RepID=A0ABU5IA90_9HYPH|nr:helix-turn-helix domain-containing protein [Fulvimarina sp. 2208YS6-2-32]MDY8111171.1 helix-turn-helix domain-containing protein [Fulvimarina sp. 2208YS6-2-32]